MRRIRVVLIGNDDFSLWHFRRGLMRALIEAGHEVWVFSPPGNYRKRIEDLGVQFVPTPMCRFMSPLRDLILSVRYWWLLRSIAPDLVHTTTIKPNIYGTLAAAAAAVPRRVSLISGMGFMFSHKGSPSAVQRIAKCLYRVALQFSAKTWFQNPDDLEFFVRQGLVRRERGVVILGSGIDTNEFSIDRISAAEAKSARSIMGLTNGQRCVLLVAARMIWSKGIAEFCAAAETLQRDFPDWAFVLVAPYALESPDAIPSAWVQKRELRSLRFVTAFQENIGAIIAQADIVALPSYYPEGLPRSLLEAMSYGKPIITTDTPGCRETVEPNRNGYLVPARDAAALSQALHKLMRSEAARSSFGRRSREIAVTRFSEKVVVSRVLSEVYQLGSDRKSLLGPEVRVSESS